MSKILGAVQYGTNIKALITSFHTTKFKSFLKDIFDLNLSQGTIANTLKKAFVSLEKVEEFFKSELRKAKIENGKKISKSKGAFNKNVENFLYLAIFYFL